ncbi:MAG: hypothetical protein FWC62_07050, partial [Firmicutes bacterium]|nr:hypothetical protein [Bacillota bacterium]
MKNKIICKSFIIFGSLFLIAVLFTSYIMAYNKNVLPNNQLKEINKSASGFSYQWGLYNQGQVINEKKGEKGIDINILKAWEITKGSSDVIVGMLDSGIELDNIEISDSIYYN